MNFHELSSMPFIQLFASPACNLSCSYCSAPMKRNRHSLLKRISEVDFLQSPEVHDLICNIPNTHFYLSGGEPLIHPGIKEFVKIAGEHGHVVSIDTNICVDIDYLNDLLESWDRDWLGFMNISHHLICNISFNFIEQRTNLIRKYGILNFVKYIGIPEHFPKIKQNMKILHNQNIGCAVTILTGEWRGRIYPRDYSLDESISLLDMMTLNTHGLQVFGGIHSKGIHCRGGQDFIAYNMNGEKEIIPCCHGSAFPKRLDETFFVTKKKDKLPCPIEQCYGDVMIISGINFITDETERFERLCRGESEFVGARSIIDFITEITRKGFRVYDRKKFAEVKRHLYPGFPLFTRSDSTIARIRSLAKRAPARARRAVYRQRKRIDPYSSLNALQVPSEVKDKTGEEIQEHLRRFIDEYPNAGSVMRNFDLDEAIQNEQDKIPVSDKRLHARYLAKKVIQDLYGLPKKINVEISALCPLNCEYCVLRDLKSFRRKSLMEYDDYKRIWRYMEPFTTEVEFTGGEPLVNKDLFDIIIEAGKTGVHTTLTTNAQLLTERKIEQVLEAKPSRILIAYDSSDAQKYDSTRIKGSLSKLKRNVERLVQIKKEQGATSPKIVLQMVVHKKNKDDVETFWEEAREVGADEATIKPILVWPGIGPEYERTMIENYLIPGHALSYHSVDENGDLVKPRQPGVCPNIQQVHIGSGSEVIPCWYLLKDTYIAGYASDEPFYDIWWSDEYIKYRKKMLYDVANKGCPGCIGIYDPMLWVGRTFNR